MKSQKKRSASSPQRTTPPRKAGSNWKLWLIFGLPVIPAVILGILSARPPRSSGPAAVASSSSTNIAASVPTNQIPENFLAEDPTEKAVQLLTQGNELLAADKLPEAIETYKRSLAIDPESEDAHYNIGIALARAGKLDEAIFHYNEALRIFPDYTEVRNNLGNLLLRKGDLVEAEKHFREAIRINPESESAHNNLGIALQRQGKMPEAAAEFLKATELMPEYLEAHFNLAQSQIALGKLSEAEQGFNRVLALRPNFEQALKGLARVQKLRQANPPNGAPAP